MMEIVGRKLSSVTFVHSSLNHVKRSRTIGHRLRGYALIERCKLSFMRLRQSQQITIGNVSRVEKARRIYILAVQQRNIVRPEGMSRQFAKRSQQISHNCGRTRRIRIAGMTDNTQNSIFRQRACRPGAMPFGGKPGMCSIVLDVRWVNQSDQYIHVQQKPAHGSSSPRRCTSSDVTRCVSLRTLSRGTPFRVLAFVSGGESARRAKQEITSPTDFFSITAISFAALKTSSSITSVVRIAYHHASYIRCASLSISCSIKNAYPKDRLPRALDSLRLRNFGEIIFSKELT